jgi:subtilisin family serine protease
MDNRWASTVLLTFLAAAMLAPVSGGPTSPGGGVATGPRVDFRPKHAPGELVVTLAPGADRDQALAYLGSLGADFDKRKDEIRGTRAVRARFDAATTDSVLDQKAAQIQSRTDLFNLVQPNYQGEALQAGWPPNDPLYVGGPQWSLDKIDLKDAWRCSTGEGVLVAVIDSGIYEAHEDLAGRLWTNPCEIPGDGVDNGCGASPGNGYADDVHGWNALDGNGNLGDDLGHGTQVAGVIGAVTGNGMGIAGVSPDVQLVPVKLFSASIPPRQWEASAAIAYARNVGVRVINASWKFDPPTIQSFVDQLNAAAQDGILVVAAAGVGQYDTPVDIDQPENVNYPCGFQLSNVACVTSTDQADALGPHSSWGAQTVDLGAPGERIWTTTNTAQLYTGSPSGTSLAAPHVSGVAALIRSRTPGLTPSQVRDLLRAGDDDPVLVGKTISGKRLNAAKALSCRRRSILDGIRAPWGPANPG